MVSNKNTLGVLFFKFIGVATTPTWLEVTKNCLVRRGLEVLVLLQADSYLII